MRTELAATNARAVSAGVPGIAARRPKNWTASEIEDRGWRERSTGAEAWRTASGGAWRPANESGCGDPFNQGAGYFDKGMVLFRFDLYVATTNGDGGEVWRLPLAHHIYLPVVVKQE